MTKAVIKLLDEVNTVILGLDENILKYFWEKFGIFVKGHFFHPKVKLGIWDGKIRFFSKTGSTYIQLLPEIVEDLKKFGYKLELIDNRKGFVIDIPKIDKAYLSAYPDTLDPTKPLTLGDHQVEAVNTVTENNFGIIVGGTGSGKSIIAACLCKLYKEHSKYRCLIIVPTTDLVTQTRADIAMYGNDTGIYSGDEKDVNHDHVVSTWQALQNNKQLTAMFNVIIIDECHGVKASVIKDILNNYAINAPVKIGLTGTLPEDPCELMNVRISLGNVLYRIPAHELIASGWLAILKLKIVQLQEDFKAQWQRFQMENPDEAKKLTYIKFKDGYFPEYKAEMAYLKANVRRNEFISNLIQQAKETRGNCLVLVNGVAYGKKLAAMIPNAYFIYGKDEKEVRQEIYKLFAENNDVVLVTSYQIGSTGLNIRRIFNMFLIDSEKNFIRVIQSIGRGLRKASDKDTVYLYDIASDLKYSKKHCTERKGHYNKEKYEFTHDKVDYMNS